MSLSSLLQSDGAVINSKPNWKNLHSQWVYINERKMQGWDETANRSLLLEFRLQLRRFSCRSLIST